MLNINPEIERTSKSNETTEIWYLPAVERCQTESFSLLELRARELQIVVAIKMESLGFLD